MPGTRKPRGGAQVVDVLAQPSTPEPVLVDAPAEPAVRPRPENELTPEQRRIRELEHRLAMEMGKKDPEVEFEAAPTNGDNIIIHFLDDGFTALGQVWFRGQELEFAPNGGPYRDTCDRYGNSWLDLRANEFAQVERWGRVMFRPGPWPGKTYLEASKVPYDALKAVGGDGVVGRPSETDLEKAQSAEARRKRAAPRLPAH